MGDYPEILDQLDLGPPVEIASVGGGCIAQAGVATFDDGTRVFVKRAAGDPKMFRCEADGLRELAKADALRVPKVIAVSDQALVLEYIESGQHEPEFFSNFGRRFAKMHQTRSRACGFAADNFIGSTPQLNEPLDGSWESAENHEGSEWTDFFVTRRLRYQVELAEQNGHGFELSRLLDQGEATILEILEPNCESPSLLHGDLWGGNFMADEQGRACLIDPAVYYGHREADLAMTRLFGGFDASFYSAYEEAWPLESEWQERLQIYQLYHLLNHLNLFGSAYYSRSKQVLERYAR
ncbi:MAG TPA: fructosamine kinase family protein [Xanthomonadales bacterium]|nr:fructosamine kinase family protein [Xanthomonadales bacterium]